MNLTLNGSHNRLDLYEDRIVITGTSRLAMSGKGGSKTLYIKQITGVQFKSATTFGPGWLHFVVPGDRDMVPCVQGAAGNENAVLFQKKDNDAAERVRAQVEELIASANGPAGSSARGADEILKYKSLLDQGVITKAEFEQQKKKLLGL